MAPPLEQTVEKSQREARNILRGYKSTSEYAEHLYLSKKLRYDNLRLYLIDLAGTLGLDSPEEYLEALKERSFEPWLTFTDEDLGALHYDHNKSDEQDDEHESHRPSTSEQKSQSWLELVRCEEEQHDRPPDHELHPDEECEGAERRHLPEDREATVLDPGGPRPSDRQAGERDR